MFLGGRKYESMGNMLGYTWETLCVDPNIMSGRVYS